MDTNSVPVGLTGRHTGGRLTIHGSVVGGTLAIHGTSATRDGGTLAIHGPSATREGVGVAT